MSLNITRVEAPTEIPNLQVAEAGDESLKEAIAQSSSEVPPPVTGVSASKMPPVTAAGVVLAKFVLWIATGSIVAFIAYLFWMDHRIGVDVLEEYSAVSYRTVPGIDLLDTGGLEIYFLDLKAALADPKFTLNADGAKNAQLFLDTIGQIPTLSSMQKAQLAACNPLPVDATRNDKLILCLSRIGEVKQDITEAKAARSAKFAEDALDRLAAQRKGVHDFWLQAAQLVLLNLLLPLLTALFGYIFGTQQQHHSP